MELEGGKCPIKNFRGLNAFGTALKTLGFARGIGEIPGNPYPEPS